MARLLNASTKFSSVDFTSFVLAMRRFFLRLGRKSCLDGLLEHLGSLPLTAQSSLALVRVQEETLLLGITPQSITLLTRIPTRRENGQLVSSTDETESLEAL